MNPIDQLAQPHPLVLRTGSPIDPVPAAPELLAGLAHLPVAILVVEWRGAEPVLVFWNTALEELVGSPELRTDTPLAALLLRWRATDPHGAAIDVTGTPLWESFVRSAPVAATRPLWLDVEGGKAVMVSASPARGRRPLTLAMLHDVTPLAVAQTAEEFVLAAAAELGAPLARAQQQLERVRDNLPSNRAVEVTEGIEAAAADLEQAEALAYDALAAVRLSSGAFRPRLQPVALGPVLAACGVERVAGPHPEAETLADPDILIRALQLGLAQLRAPETAGKAADVTRRREWVEARVRGGRPSGGMPLASAGGGRQQAGAAGLGLAAARSMLAAIGGRLFLAEEPDGSLTVGFVLRAA